MAKVIIYMNTIHDDAILFVKQKDGWRHAWIEDGDRVNTIFWSRGYVPDNLENEQAFDNWWQAEDTNCMDISKTLTHEEQHSTAFNMFCTVGEIFREIDISNVYEHFKETYM